MKEVKCLKIEDKLVDFLSIDSCESVYSNPAPRNSGSVIDSGYIMYNGKEWRVLYIPVLYDCYEWVTFDNGSEAPPIEVRKQINKEILLYQKDTYHLSVNIYSKDVTIASKNFGVVKTNTSIDGPKVIETRLATFKIQADKYCKDIMEAKHNYIVSLLKEGKDVLRLKD